MIFKSLSQIIITIVFSIYSIRSLNVNVILKSIFYNHILAYKNSDYQNHLVQGEMGVIFINQINNVLLLLKIFVGPLKLKHLSKSRYYLSDVKGSNSPENCWLEGLSVGWTLTLHKKNCTINSKTSRQQCICITSRFHTREKFISENQLAVTQNCRIPENSNITFIKISNQFCFDVI